MDDEELLVVTKTLLNEVEVGLKDKKCIVFMPGDIDLSEEVLIRKKNDFKYKNRVCDVSTLECFRLLGVILYHLTQGKSEHDHEAYIIDGIDAYLNLSFDLSLWPVVAKLLQERLETVDQVKNEIEHVLENTEKVDNNSDTDEKSIDHINGDDVVRVDRSKFQPPWYFKPLYPDLQNRGPSENHINHVEERLFPDQNEDTITEDINKILLINDELEIHLEYADLVAMQQKGIEFFRMHFADKEVYAWRSIAYHNGAGNWIPLLREDDGQLNIHWHHYLGRWHPECVSLRFNEATKNMHF